MQLLTLTTLYPNREMIRNGVFVRERIRKLVDATPDLNVTVVAPVPWFPFRSKKFGRYGTFARVPREEQDDSIRVLHPRYLQIPRVGELLAPFLYFRAVRSCLARNSLGEFDVLDAHFAFPDGVAAVLLGRALGKPVTITVRGSDINVIAEERIAGRWIRWALHRCSRVIAVSTALAGRVKTILDNAQEPDVAVVRNGVDTETFYLSEDPGALRHELGLEGRVVLSVGNLIALKGHDLVIRAVAEIPQATLCIIGAGPQRSALEQLARSLGVADRVRFCGEMSQSELVRYYNAADVTVLASSHEGLPNVVLESLACGTPVVATSVGGIPEVMTNPVMGVMLPERSAAAIRQALSDVLDKDPPRARLIRESIRSFSWNRTVKALQAILADLDSSTHRTPHCNAPGGLN